MSLLPYKVTALARVDNGDLNIIPNASVTVLTSGGTYAQIYEADGTTPILNPFNCDDNGERQIYLPGGSYTISVAGGQSWEIRLSGASDTQSVATMDDLVRSQKRGGSVFVRGWHTGSTLGGGMFTWSPGTARSFHNGSYIISPTVPAPSDQPGATLGNKVAAFINGNGEAEPEGLGCWTRSTDAGRRRFDLTYAGIATIVGDIAAPLRAVSQFIQSDSRVVFAPGVYAIRWDANIQPPSLGANSHDNSYLTLYKLRNVSIEGYGVRLEVTGEDITSHSMTIFGVYGCDQIAFRGFSINMQCTGGSNTVGTRFRWCYCAPADDGTLTSNITWADSPYLRCHNPAGGTPAGETGDGTSNYAKCLGIEFKGDFDGKNKSRGFSFTNNRVFDTTARTVWLWYLENYNITGNQFINVGDPHSIRLTVCDNFGVISDNIFEGRSSFSAGQIVITKATATDTSRCVVIANNIFKVANNDAVRLFGCTKINISNNIFTVKDGYSGTMRRFVVLSQEAGSGCNDIKISNCQFFGFSGGVYDGSLGSNLVIDSCNFSGQSGNMIELSGSVAPLISNTNFYDSPSTSIRALGVASGQVRSCLFKDGSIDIWLTQTQGFRVRSCDFIGGDGRSINGSVTTEFPGAITGTVLEGNSWYGNTFSDDAYIIRSNVTTSDGRIFNNVFDGNTAKSYYDSGSATVRSANNIVDGTVA